MDSKGPQSFDPDTWVDMYGNYLYRCAVGYVRDRSLAEDMVQETFLAALKSSASFTGQSSQKTWLVGILKHKIIDHFRKANRLTQPFDIEVNGFDRKREVVEVHGQEASVRMNRHADPGTMAERAAFWDMLTKGLAGLSPHIAAAFSLREIDQLNSRDVCNQLGISKANLWVMLHRARRYLRQYFASNGFDNAA
jgi:RNA polymerase sigma-70 factor, ECF subfamily